jgi:hypothetical protein
MAPTKVTFFAYEGLFCEHLIAIKALIMLENCHRATVVESGKGVSETWDYGAGDVWYFRPNEGHMIQGIASGCTYLAGDLYMHLRVWT